MAESLYHRWDLEEKKKKSIPKGYRALNVSRQNVSEGLQSSKRFMVSRPALQIPMTLFLAFTFPRLPLTLRFRLIPLSRRRRGI